MNAFKTAVKVFLFMTVLTGLIYPLVITGVAQLTMARLANGSLIQKGNQTLGSALIAQNTTEDRYFWPRPSAVDYDPMKPSGGSNLGPTSQKLKEAIQERKQKVGDQASPELLYASGSGLDPHINLETAYFQIPRVAKARSMNEGDLKNLIDHLSEGKQLGFLGERYVNVLNLNQALDEHK
ncbi:Potassium-transporting ATPase, subunit C [Candidatus Protochlamydia naegleriophila]|uniref:Potassium-transporting ATPase KdpC subunit n=2 Tax=Candidatus Protochlamydia naegleriophila TaxID=389348 RepID=A0A0U5JHA7_9BACT|nr:potassium-transporting ATPase subunit KdpC [Candidatus Protochlamydia naegleriophila]CUI17986.1 Potassium-transporting ATPase, subunit C [Candidatus Protochlamydia naegleriophila]